MDEDKIKSTETCVILVNKFIQQIVNQVLFHFFISCQLQKIKL